MGRLTPFTPWIARMMDGTDDDVSRCRIRSRRVKWVRRIR